MTLTQINRKINDLNAKLVMLQAKIERIENPDEFEQTTEKKIIKAVAEYYNLDRYSLSAKNKSLVVCRPRMVAMYIIKKGLNISHARTGFNFELDHSTCVHACKTVSKDISIYPKFRKEVVEIMQIVGFDESKIKILT